MEKPDALDLQKVIDLRNKLQSLVETGTLTKLYWDVLSKELAQACLRISAIIQYMDRPKQQRDLLVAKSLEAEKYLRSVEIKFFFDPDKHNEFYLKHNSHYDL